CLDHCLFGPERARQVGEGQRQIRSDAATTKGAVQDPLPDPVDDRGEPPATSSGGDEPKVTGVLFSDPESLWSAVQEALSCPRIEQHPGQCVGQFRCAHTATASLSRARFGNDLRINVPSPSYRGSS